MKKIITGLKTTTTNENNQAMQDLGNIWNIFFAEKYNEKLKDFAQNNKVYAVYTNYKGDFKSGDYDFYLGVETNSIQKDFENIEVVEENFEVFEFPYQKPEGTIEAWKTIWSNTELERKYSFDLEEYDYENGKLKIYISVN